MKCFVMQLVAWRDKAGASRQEITLSSSREEADTTLFLHAVQVSNSCSRHQYGLMDWSESEENPHQTNI